MNDKEANNLQFFVDACQHSICVTIYFLQLINIVHNQSIPVNGTYSKDRSVLIGSPINIVSEVGC